MSRRIDIELTSALGDGTWTWRAAGAKQPKGVLDGAILPDDAKVGDELKVEVEQEIDGITVLGTVHGREKAKPSNVIELLPAERDFQPVVETRAKRDRGEGRGRDGDRRPRRDRDRRPRSDGDGGDRRGGARPEGRDGQGRGRDGARREGRGGQRRGPNFTPPPEVPKRPKPKRLRPGKAHRNAVLEQLPPEQRPIAELTLQGMAAVRQRLREENQRATQEGRAVMPEATVLKMAEDLLPKLRAAEWRDRAEAAQRQLDHLDLRDLRSVVAAAGDPAIARDESTSTLVTDLQAALARKQEEELVLWFGDVDAALAVGRVVRALRLSSQPPKAGVPFPTDIAQRLADSTNASLAPMDSPDRWIAMLEAAAFSPIRSLILPVRKPDVVTDDLLTTIKRLAPALPQVAALFEIEVDPKAAMPKPLRPTYGKAKDGKRKDTKTKDSKNKDSKNKAGDGRRGDKPARHSEKSAAEPATAPVTSESAATQEAVPATQPTTSAETPTTATETPTTPAEPPTTPAEPPAGSSEKPAAEPVTSEPAPAQEVAPATEPPAGSSEKPAADPVTSEPARAQEVAPATESTTPAAPITTATEPATTPDVTPTTVTEPPVGS